MQACYWYYTQPEEGHHKKILLRVQNRRAGALQNGEETIFLNRHHARMTKRMLDDGRQNVVN